ncbi:MAG: cobalt ECF transporter T component CbiQ [Gloeomargarita sp. SKYBB_i_bin120]|nr:cobalt ECF transporter T component CbiQ [Gloeomargarita sp. SKYB120]MDW8178305.1 cobalt ECF transporter T component CbiQ [Gloeomargarita sp. SKYBB_i_bin120]
MHHHLDSYAYRNGLRYLPPSYKLGFALGLLILALMAQPLTQALLALWLSLWTVGYARIPARVYAAWLGIMLLFWALSLPALVIQVVPTPPLRPDVLWGTDVFGSWHVFLSRRGLHLGWTTGLRSLACSSCLLFVLLTTPFADLLRVFRRWHVSPLLLDLLLLMYRLIFLLLDEALTMHVAQRARGGYRNWRRGLQSLALLTGQLWLRTLHRYEQLTLGLAARGWQGQWRVELPATYHLPRRYAIEAVGGGLGLLVLEWSVRSS